MKSHKQTVKLEDICHLITDGKHGDCHNQDNSGYYFLSAKDVNNGKLNYEKARQITKEDFLQTHKRTQLEPCDILLSNSGTIGRMAIAKNSGLTYRTTFQKSVALLKPDKDKVIIQWLYYFLHYRKESLINAAGGTAQKNLLLRDLRAFKIDLPPLPIQRKIAGILSAYDRLIENNTRRIEILEEMARSIYREWFVKFRFPGHEQVQMVDSELGLIPEGWKMGGVIDFGEVITGKTPSKAKPEYYGDYMPFIKTPSMHGNMFCIEVDEYLSKQGVASQRNKILPPNCLLVNCIGALAGSVSITSTDSQTNQQINAVVLKNKEDREFLYFNLVDLKELIRQYGSNGATMINLNKSKFEALPAVHPELETLSAFHKLTFPQFDLIKNLQIKNTNLRQTRDLLLPRLISGEIDVENLDINTGEIAA